MNHDLLSLISISKKSAITRQNMAVVIALLFMIKRINRHLLTQYLLVPLLNRSKHLTLFRQFHDLSD